MKPILPSSINYAPSLTPAIKDPTAPTAQAICPGYRASNVQESDTGVTADLTLAGQACNAYGTDIEDLTLTVEYQSQDRLAVRISPKYITAENETQYLLSPELTPQPNAESGSTNASSNLVFTWSNEPSFQFQVSRAATGDVLFNTYGSVIVFENQFLELVTQMVPNYNIYGFAGNVRGFRLPNNYTRTFVSPTSGLLPTGSDALPQLDRHLLTSIVEQLQLDKRSDNRCQRTRHPTNVPGDSLR